MLTDSSVKSALRSIWRSLTICSADYQGRRGVSIRAGSWPISLPKFKAIHHDRRIPTLYLLSAFTPARRFCQTAASA